MVNTEAPSEEPTEQPAGPLVEPEPRQAPASRVGWLRPTPTRGVDVVLAGLLTLATFWVHSVHFILSAPYWVDESWVAVSTRLPLRSAPHLTSSTPLGWTVLLRAAFFGGAQRQRMIPLLFSAFAVLLAFCIARNLPWRSPVFSRVAGALAGLAVLLAPSSLVRNDLKQYTADAFVTMAIMLLLSQAERSFNRRWLVALTAVCGFGFLISAAALFVAVAAFVSLVLVCLVARNWRQLKLSVAYGAGAAVALGIFFEAFYKPHVDKALTTYWTAYYLPLHKGLHGVWRYLDVRSNQMASYLGMGPLLLAVILVLAGVVTLFQLGNPVLALFGPLLVGEMIVLGAAKKYPLFDERTSHFLTVMFAVYAAIGVAGFCMLISRRTVLIGLVAAIALAATFVVHVKPFIRDETIPRENLRTPTRYVAAHLQSHDVVLVNSSGNWAFSYYWPIGHSTWYKSDIVANGFQMAIPTQPNILFASGRTEATLDAAFTAAETKAHVDPAGRIWLLRMHVTRAEDRLWQAALARSGMNIQRVTNCSLMLLTPLPAGSEPSPGDLKTAACS